LCPLNSRVEILAGIGNDSSDLFKAAVRSIGTAVDRVKPDFSEGDGVAFYRDIGIAHIALGAMIGGDRKVMVESLRPQPEY
jgi:hypothetical protein